MRSGPPLRAAIVGAGLMGRWHADAVTRAGGAVSVIVDPDGHKAASLAARHPGSHTMAALGEVVQGGRVDVVHVCTPLETHEALATQALQGGMHVLVEKPLAQSAAHSGALLQLAEARGLLLCPVHQLLFQPGVRRAQEALPAIHPLLHVDTIACSAGASDNSDEARDHSADAILPHPLSLLARMLPEPLSSVQWSLHQPLAGELRATGSTASVSLSLVVSMRGRPTQNMLHLIGEHGTVHVDLFHGFHVVEGAAVSRAHKIAHPFLLAGDTLRAATANLALRTVHREVAYPGLRELICRFYRAVRREAPPPITAGEILEVAAAADTLGRRRQAQAPGASVVCGATLHRAPH